MFPLKKDEGEDLSLESSLAKLFISEISHESANDAVQIHGGYGYIDEYHVERFYRDSKLGTLGGGTSEIQRNIISSFFPGVSKWEAKIEQVHQGMAKKDYPETLKTEIAIIQCLEELIRQSQGKMPKDKSLSAAFADLLTLDYILSQSLRDCFNDSPHYPSAQKQKDYKILTWLLTGRYIYSLQSFSIVGQETVSKLLQIYSTINTKQVKDHIHDCVDFLYQSMN